jgi:iron complex transport system substrate-binding protein
VTAVIQGLRWRRYVGCCYSVPDMPHVRCVLSLLFLSCSMAGVAVAQSPCERVISLAPSITETLFELGLGSTLIGRTDFCRYPPEAKTVDSIGGFYDVNLERLLAKKPTHVFALKENARSVEALRRFGIPVTEVDHSSRRGIRASLLTIASACGVRDRAERRLVELDREEAETIARCESNRGPVRAETIRAMVVVGRTREGSDASGVYISGQDGFYAELLAMLGVRNVNTRSTVAVPSLSTEGIMSLNPDVILEIVNVDDAERPERLLSFWRSFSSINAVKNNRVFLIDDDYASIPGPRYIHVLRLFASKVCQSHS